jgi:UDP-N-acetylglucosamine acyltransferase
MSDNQPKRYDDFLTVGTNKIHRTALLGDVELGENNIIGAYAVLGGYGGMIGDFASKGKVIIGNNNIIHNHVEIKGPYRSDITRIGNNNLIMDYVNIGHDCVMEDHCVIATGSRIAGRCHIESWVSLGLNSILHQRIKIGHTAMVGMGSIVTSHVEPEYVYIGQPAKKVKKNDKGIDRRKGLPD